MTKFYGEFHVFVIIILLNKDDKVELDLIKKYIMDFPIDLKRDLDVVKM